MTTVQEAGTKTIPNKKKRKKAKRLSEEALQTAEKKQRRKGKIYPSEFRVPKNSRERQESLPQGSMQRNREKQYKGRLETSSRKLEIPREHFMQR